MTTPTRDVPPDRSPDRPGLDNVRELVATSVHEYPTDPATVDADSARQFIAATDTAWDEWSEGQADPAH